MRLIHTSAGSSQGARRAADEAVGAGGVGCGEDVPAVLDHSGARPRWTCSGVSRPMPPCRCSVLYHWKNVRQKSFASSMQPNRPGKPGWYLTVLNCASEYGFVVRDPGAAQRLRDAQVGQQLRRALGRHGSAPDALMFVKRTLGR